MGLILSSPRAVLSEDEIEELKEETGFDARQIVRLYSRFCHLDKGDNYLLSREDLERIPELAINPLCSRVLDLFFPAPSDGEGAETMINFPKFLDLLSIFQKSRRADTAQQREKKLKFVFDLYDADKDGVITRKELFDVICIMVGEYDNDMLQEVVVNTLIEATGTEDGPLDYESFKAVMKSCDVEQSLVVGFG